MSLSSRLSEKSLIIILAAAPTGLGHLRVTHALYHGLPKHVSPTLLGAQDRSIDQFYRIVTINPVSRLVMEWLQDGPLSEFYTDVAQGYLRSHTKLLYQQMLTILGGRLTVPRTVLIVATHNALAHQLGEIKKQLEQETGARIILVVQVTDDSPQPLWYIKEADTIFVPSEYTKAHLLAYAKKLHLPLVPIQVTAYPVSPLFAESLTPLLYENRLKQAEFKYVTTIHVSIPVSGAAVGTSFISQLMTLLHDQNHRFCFHVISKEAGYTKMFLEQMKPLPYVKEYTSTHDRTTVDNYETIFKHTVISLEITKPSEQAFKALITPQQRGGVILLFSKPIGRQEYDNLHFLRTHHLMPDKQTQKRLWQLAKLQRPFTYPETAKYIKQAQTWRALRLPDVPGEAALFTNWCLRQGIFAAMIRYKNTEVTPETNSDGVQQFWNQVAELLDSKHI